MSERKKCTYCQGRIQNRKKIVRFINVTLDINYLFCSGKCKKAWLSERIQKSQIDGEEWSLDTPEASEGEKTKRDYCYQYEGDFDDMDKEKQPEPNKNFIETIEENRKLLKAEYQRGYADGGANMNEKWVITMKELLERKSW